MPENIKLSRRLSAVADLVEKNSIVADIGTDHGYIPAYLIINGISKAALACDINVGPLESAKSTAREYEITDKIEFVLTDGLSGLDKYEFDTVIIAGMGGETVVHILDNSRWLFDRNCTLILQPQSKIEYFSKWITENGFKVLDTVLVEDNNRIYNIFKIKFTGCAVPESDPEYYCYKKIAGLDSALSKKYIDDLILKAERSLAGLEKSKDKPVDAISEKKNLIFYLSDRIKETAND